LEGCKPPTQGLDPARVYDDSSESARDSARNRTADQCDDPRLAAVIEAWATLPEAVRAGIAAMVNASAE